MIHEYKNKVAWCPLCDQGWVMIKKEIVSGDLFCYCDECLNIWLDPSNITPETSVALFIKGIWGDSCEPTEEEITLRGWQKYIICEPFPNKSAMIENVVYTKHDMHTMDPMHDMCASSIKSYGKHLIIEFDHLNGSISDTGSKPPYRFQKLTIIYQFSSYCNVILYGDHTYQQCELADFLNYAKQLKLKSCKYSVDSFRQLKLDYSIYAQDSSPNELPQWHTAEICLDPQEITYSWRME